MDESQGIFGRAQSVKSTIAQFADRLKNINSRVKVVEANNNSARSRVPLTLGVPFKTAETVGDMTVWAVEVDVGSLPNATTKMVQIPSDTTSEWGGMTHRWIDTASSRAYNTASQISLPLPYQTLVEGDPDLPKWDDRSVFLEGDMIIHLGRVYEANWYSQGDDPIKKSGSNQTWTDLGTIDEAAVPRKLDKTDMIDVFLKGTFIHVMTTSNRSDYEAVVRIKYLKSR